MFPFFFHGDLISILVLGLQSSTHRNQQKLLAGQTIRSSGGYICGFERYLGLHNAFAIQKRNSTNHKFNVCWTAYHTLRALLTRRIVNQRFAACSGDFASTPRNYCGIAGSILWRRLRGTITESVARWPFGCPGLGSIEIVSRRLLSYPDPA
jgi:hypothetical protein